MAQPNPDQIKINSRECDNLACVSCGKIPKEREEVFGPKQLKNKLSKRNYFQVYCAQPCYQLALI